MDDALSEDVDANRENQSEWERSIDLSVQFLDDKSSTDARNTGDEDDQGSAAMSDTLQILSLERNDEASSQNLGENGQMEIKGDDSCLLQQEANRSTQSNRNTSCEEHAMANVPSFALQQCDSPTIPKSDDHQQDGIRLTPEKQHELREQDDVLMRHNINTHSSDVKLESQISLVLATDKFYRSSDLSLLRAASRADAIDLNTDLDEATGNVVSPKEANPCGATKPADKSTVPKTSAYESSMQQTADIKFQPVDALENTCTAKTPLYTVESLFPVVYENKIPTLQSGIPKEMLTRIALTKPCTEQRKRTCKGTAENSTAQNPLGNEQVNQPRTFKLQLSMLELDNKKLSQRNARLKKQLALVAADLQRSRAELAKLKTENELYSVKLPQLQAELLEETSQVDETQALSVQNQLLLTQFKARSHVLQTRNVGLEAQNDKLTKQVRDCQKQLKQKAAALQHQIEKANRLEADMNELKATHAQRRKSWNIQMESALKRFEYDKSKLVAQIKNKEAKDLHEGSNRAEKAMKKRRTAEKLFAGNLEGQLKNCKDELASSKDAIRRQSKEVCTLEALLRKSHRIEGKLRNDLALVRAKCRTLDEERKCRMAQPPQIRSRGRGLGKKFPIELLLPLSDISDDDDQQVQQCRNCLATTQINELQSTCPPLSGCGNCLQLQDQLHQLHQELRRLRSLHTAEVHAQASAFDALLQKCSKKTSTAGVSICL